MYFSKITATGAYVPESVITNDDLSKIVDTNDEWIVSRSGIRNRHFAVAEDENTSDIAAKACKMIIERSNISPEEIDLLIVATVSADYSTPSTACLVQAKVGAKNAIAFDIGAACSGFIFGLSIANKYIQAGTVKNVVVIGAEVLSKYLDFTDRGTCVLFGDGAAGVLLQRSQKRGIIAEEIGSDGSKGHALTGGDTPVKNAFSKCDGKANRSLKMDGRAIFDFATRQVPKSVESLLKKSETDRDTIDFVIAHQANSRIVQIISKKLKIPMEKFYLNMYEYGNTSSASIPIALNEMMEKGLIKEDSLGLLTGFGAGLTWGSMLIRF
ncbi:MAG: ketoacyl-ACP synthase III [Clostridia bacterium]|jgi:3-oxoacyl-[acyl-carrier-protein] synthase-3|nr:ketoacyl-ACP synthase III [Clostridia bacterium]MCI2000029.1 ketoacyl-ACP synthase III [Clostridia bacterium]MCI2014437.1 ketoacyl-ACP synthase III [Clostridia bacterium]